MTPVKQTVLFGDNSIGNGNCFAACLASLLDLPLWMVPPFEQMFAHTQHWSGRCDRWLERFFALKLVEVRGHKEDALPEFYIACGSTPRGTFHATIYSRGELVHDPHFSGDGIIKVEFTRHLEPISPAQSAA